MRTFAPIAIAAALFLGVVGVVYWTFGLVGGSDAGSPVPLTQRSATGNMLLCGGQAEVQSVYSEMGDSFSVTGQLASQEPGRILVRGPTGYIWMTLAAGSVVEGPNVSGQPVQVTGVLDEQGNAQATYVRSACEGGYVAVPPTAAPAPPQQPAPTPAVTEPPAPSDQGDSSDGGETSGRGRGKDKRGRR